MAVPAASDEAQKRLSLWRHAAAASLDMGSQLGTRRAHPLRVVSLCHDDVRYMF
jgi:hypothetical protein